LGVAIGVNLLNQQFMMLEKPSEADAKKLEESYLSYLQEGPLPPMVESGFTTANILYEIGHRDRSIAVLEAMKEAFADAKEVPQIDLIQSELDWQLVLKQLDLPQKLRNAVKDDQKFAAVEGALDELIKDESQEAKWLEFMYGTAVTFERIGKQEIADKVYDRLVKLGESAKQLEVAKKLKQFLANAQARKKLIGQPLDFSAATASDEEFKLSSLKGKRTVVLFWSAQDGGGSYQELANIEEALLISRSAFEVVIVNVDDDAGIFQRFSEIPKVAWAAASVRLSDADKPGLSSDVEKQLGLDQLPFSVLLDAEGKVEATFAQASRLRSLVGAQPAEAPGDATAKPGEKPAESSP
jgi:hypothetical protein